MKVFKAVEFHMQYQRANSKEGSIANCEFVLHRFRDKFSERVLISLIHATVPSLNKFTDGHKLSNGRLSIKKLSMRSFSAR